MRQANPHRATLAMLASLALAVLAAAPATAATPRSFELPDATHAGELAIAQDGTVWFVPSRGSEWKGHDYSLLGSLAPDGTVSEREIGGFVAIGAVAIDPEGDVWVSGFRGRYEHKIFEIARLSPAGELLQSYTVGSGRGGIRSIAASDDAVWWIRGRVTPTGHSESIERIAIPSEQLGRFALPPECHVSALDVAPDGTPWFTQKCGGFLGEGASSKTSVSRITPSGKIIRRRIAARNYPVTLKVGADGTVWFGAWRYYQANRIGRLTSSGKLAEYRVPNSDPWTIAVGPEGRLWFPSFDPRYALTLDTIGPGGHLGKPICADPTCRLEPNDITAAPDGNLWYGLQAPNTDAGGGGSGIYITEQIANEPGFLGHLIF